VTTPPLHQDPLTAPASEYAWRRWLATLLTGARERLAAAGLLVVGSLIVCSASLWLFASIASELVEGDTQQLDDAVLLWLRRFANPTLDDFATMITAFGSEALVLVFALLLVAFVVQRRWGAAASLTLVTLGAQLLNNVLKMEYQRVRPGPVAASIAAQQWSFPSGHATVAAAFYLFLAYLAWRGLRGPARLIWPIALVALVLAIDVTRLYLGVHYLTDVVAGNAIGAAWAASVMAASHLLSKVWLQRRPRSR
jgi:undecaprenyl-diphosphatase